MSSLKNLTDYNFTSFQMNLSSQNSDPYTILLSQSLATLLQTNGSSVGLLIVGSLAVVTNIIIIAMIVKSPLLNLRCNFLVLHLAVADELVGLSYAVTGAKRLIRYSSGVGEVCNQVQCMGELFVSFFSQSASLTLAIAMGLERVMAILLPIPYKKHGKNAIAALAALAWLYSSVCSSFAFYGISTSIVLTSCNLVLSVTGSFYTYSTNQDTAFTVLIILIQMVVIGSLYWQVHQAKKRNKNLARVKKELQTKVTKTLAVAEIRYFILQLTTRVALSYTANLPSSIRANYQPFIRMLMILNSGIGLFFYIALCEDYRKAFYVLIGKKNNKVTPGSNVHHVQPRKSRTGLAGPTDADTKPEPNQGT